MNDDAIILVGFLVCFLPPMAVLLALIAFGAFDGLPGMAVFLVVCVLGIAAAVIFTKYMLWMTGRERDYGVDSPRRRLGSGSRSHFDDYSQQSRTCRRCR